MAVAGAAAAASTCVEGIRASVAKSEPVPARGGFLATPIGFQATATPLAFCDFRREQIAFRRCACDSRNE